MRAASPKMAVAKNGIDRCAHVFVASLQNVEMFKFEVPSLTVGTLDSLMVSLSENQWREFSV